MLRRRTKKDAAGRRRAGVVLLAATLVCVCSWVWVALAQLDLSVFRKEGVGEEEQSNDRFECHRRAVQRTGFDPALRPQEDLPPMGSREEKEVKAHQSVEWRKQQLHYNDALKSCMTERGYTIAEH